MCKRPITLLLLVLLLTATAAQASRLTLNTQDLSGAPHARVGWGFSLYNDSAFDLYVLRVTADGTLYGTKGVSAIGTFRDDINENHPGAGITVATGTTYSGSFPTDGLASFAIDADAPDGGSVNGNIYLDYELYDSSMDFQGAGTLTAQYNSQDALASVTITISSCGPGISLTTALWQQLALPCVPATTTVGTTLGANTTGQLDAAIYGNAGAGGWLMYGNDLVNNKNLRLDVHDPLTNGVGYWLKSFSAPAGGGNLTVTGTATVPDVTFEDGCASTNGCKAVTVATVEGADRYNLVGNPFPYNVDWAKVVVEVDGFLLFTPSSAQESGYLSNQIWIYNGTSYDTWSDVSVPDPGNLKYFQSFWVKVLSGAAGHTVRLLIPAEQSTHSQVVPASATRLATRAHPWYGAWLDWLIAPAAAADEAGFGPGQHPAARPLRGLAPPAAAPVAAVTDPTIDLLTAQGLVAQGLAPAQAERAAHATALAEGREWYVRLLVDEPATGYRDHTSILGQLLTAQDGYDPQDLAELPPFGTPYLTLVFPHAAWGAQAGDYASDFRAAVTPQRPSALPATDWAFQIRSDRPGTQVILRWAGDPTMLKRSQLLDPTAGTTIDPAAYADGYPVTLTTGTRAFTWRFLGTPGPRRWAGAPRPVPAAPALDRRY